MTTENSSSRPHISNEMDWKLCLKFDQGSVIINDETYTRSINGLKLLSYLTDRSLQHLSDDGATAPCRLIMLLSSVLMIIAQHRLVYKYRWPLPVHDSCELPLLRWPPLIWGDLIWCNLCDRIILHCTRTSRLRHRELNSSHRRQFELKALHCTV